MLADRRERMIFLGVIAASAVFGAAGIVVRCGARHPANPPAEGSEARDVDAEPAPSTLTAAPDASVAGGGAAQVDAAPPPAAPFNVVLVTIDTLRADLGFAGYPRPVSTNLDALAARSAVFERAYSTASYTMKALCALLSGRYASEAPRDYQHYTHFPKPNVFLGERLHDARVTTVGIHVQRYFTLAHGMERGFDVWDLSAMPPAMKDTDPRPTSDRITDAAIQQLSTPAATKAAEEKKLFVWLHYYDPHAPYAAPPGAPDFSTFPPTSEQRLRDVYDAEVWFTDKHVGRLFGWIASRPWADATALVVTADHGEAFGEKGHFRHNKELWEPIVRVPLIVNVPGRAPRRIGVKRSHVDLVPTILALMGLEPRADHPALRGKSLLADVDAAPGAPLEERDVLLDMPQGELNEARRALLTGPSPGLKLHHRRRAYELYDLATDPGEQNLVPESDPRFADARARLDAVVGTLEERPAIR